MKKPLLLIIAIICTLQVTANTQEVGYYYCNNFSGTTDAKVIMYPNQRFEVFINQEFNENGFFHYLFSYGDYTLLKDTIVFTDFIDQYVIKFLDCGSYILPLRSLIFYQNKKFIKEPGTNIISKELFQDEKEAINIQLKRKLKIFNYNYSNLEGTYTHGYTSAMSFKLNLYREGIYKKYKLTYNNQLISSGQWFNNWNRIGLYDTAIKHTFYFMSTEGGVINLGFPPIPETYRGFWKKK